jgi:TolB protein
MSTALAAGVVVALLWLYQNPRGSLEMLPDALARATSASVSPTGEAATDATLPDAAEAAESAEEVGAANASNGVTSQDFSARLVPAQQVTLVPPTATASSTPLPPLESVEAVVGIGGVTLWDGTSGLLMGQAEQGALFIATARSSDGQWLYGTLEDGSTGWAEIEQLIVFDAERLRSEEVVIIPITPTPAAQGGAGAAPQVTGQMDSAETLILRPTPIAGDAPLAQVALQESRLNLRAGPGSSHPVIAKAQPNERFALLARDATSQWLQLALPDVAGGFGWAAAEYLRTDAVIADLPISNEVSSAPLYQEGTGESKGGQALPQSQEKPEYAEPQGALSGAKYTRKDQPATASVTGLSGKLAIQTSWGGDIYIYDLATGELRLLTGGFDPAISPDGTQVAFTRIGGEHGLYLINIDGSNERKIFSERTHFLSPKWSPDGRYIVFERGDEFLNCTLFPLDDPDPSGNCLVDREPENWEETQQKLARVDLNGENYQDIPVLPRARVPDWNSAGIVYQSPAGIQKTQDQPGAQSQLVFFNIRKQYELDPDWQPNGGQIIFQRRENDHWEIYSVSPDGSGLRALTYPKFTLVRKLPSNVAPAWSPDGQHVVFLSNRDLDDPNEGTEFWNVWVMNADGSNQRPLAIDLPFIYTFVAEQMLDWGR